MLFKARGVGFALALIGAYGWSSAWATPAFFQAAVSGGVLIVNQTSGTITYCSGLINGRTNKPLGKCAVIGTISPTNLAGNLQINAGTTASDVAFVTNVASGATLQCGLMVNGYTGAPYGGCVALQAN
jgi:hypothetical protein